MTVKWLKESLWNRLKRINRRILSSVYKRGKGKFVGSIQKARYRWMNMENWIMYSERCRILPTANMLKKN